jgi:hypothetical protein
MFRKFGTSFARFMSVTLEWRKMEFLGHVVSHAGISTDPSSNLLEIGQYSRQGQGSVIEGAVSYLKIRCYLKYGLLSASEKVPLIWGKVEQESFQ